MKITRRQLRKIIKESVARITEMQVYKGSGLEHGFSDDELHRHVLQFLKSRPDVKYAGADRENAEALLRTLTKRIQKAVTHRSDNAYDDDYNLLQSYTTDEETELMRAKQAKLKLAKLALMSAMGERQANRSRSDDFRRQSQEFDDAGVDKYSHERPYYIRKN